MVMRVGMLTCQFVNNGLANCLSRSGHDTHEAILLTISPITLFRRTAINSYQLAISSIRREVLTLIALKNIIRTHVVLSSRCLAVKSRLTWNKE